MEHHKHTRTETALLLSQHTEKNGIRRTVTHEGLNGAKMATRNGYISRSA